MRNLRTLFSNRFKSGAKKRRRSAMRSRGLSSTGRLLSSESLEKRELLAGDVVENGYHNYHTPYDVNADYRITAMDALVVLNKLQDLHVSGESISGSDEESHYPDVNNDGRLSASDALGVINAIGRGEGVNDEVVEMFLSVRDANDQAIAPDLAGEYNIPVGEKFFVEIAYSDLRTPQEAKGAYQIRADVTANLPDYLVPVMSETQRLRFDQEASTSANLQSVTFTQDGVTYVAPAGSWQANPIFEVVNAMTTFGYENPFFGQNPDYTLDQVSFTDDDYGFVIHWFGDDFDDVDVLCNSGCLRVDYISP